MADPVYRVMNIVGARPNMMKVAPLLSEMARFPDMLPTLVHTGQHYDQSMSDVFLRQLGMPKPNYNLDVGSGSHHFQTAEVMKRFGDLLQQDRPDLIVVVGDVNSTLACALVAAKEGVPVAHVEAGLRSFDRTMPEEINRLVTDAVADLLFASEESALVNLQQEGIPKQKVFFVGNVMIDSLLHALESARRSELVSRLGLPVRGYAVLTLHRPANVDCQDRFVATIEAIRRVAVHLPILFPLHPRTASRITSAQINSFKTWNASSPISGPGIWTMPPASYLDFLGLVDRSALVITDSGGVQEETTFLGVPCLTFRNNTERPVTVLHGTNRLIGTDPSNLTREAIAVLETPNGGRSRTPLPPPPLWDGRTSRRIVTVLRKYLQGDLEQHRQVL